ncbi:MAG: hypothetical protein Q9205_003137 [Flavoplaca limonia]
MALLRQLDKDKNIAVADIPPVTTATTMQGNETEIVIYCSVLSKLMGWVELGMQRDEGLMNVANTRARRLFLHFCSNKITKTGPGTLVEQIAKSSANKKAGEAMSVPYRIEMVNERAQPQQIYDPSNSREAAKAEAAKDKVIKEEEAANEAEARADAAKADVAKAKEDEPKRTQPKKQKPRRKQPKRTQPRRQRPGR